jgi:hypothetical protein
VESANGIPVAMITTEGSEVRVIEDLSVQTSQAPTGFTDGLTFKSKPFASV